MSGLRAPRGGTGPGTHADRLVPEDLKTRTREAAVEAGQVTASDLPACGVCQAIGETHTPWCSTRRSAPWEDAAEAGLVDRSARVIPEARPASWPKLSEVSLELLALTADYPLEHPLRQAARASLITRLALAEGKIQTAAEVLAEGIRELAVTSEPEHPAMSKALEILKR